MVLYVIRRVGLSALVVAGVVCLTFLISRVIPGDPAANWAGPRAGAVQIAQARHALGMDRPLAVQIVAYFKGVLTGNWGVSIHTHRPVLSDILGRLPASLELVIAAILLGLVIGVPLGVIAARWANRPVDHLVRTTAVFSVSLPAFWFALILQVVFVQHLHLLPAAGEYSADLQFSHPLTSITGAPVVDALITGNWQVLGSAVTHLILPAVIIGSYPVGVVARMVRARLLDVSHETHTQMVRSLGFSERSILSRFSLRLAWSPVAQVIALIFAYALVNTFLVEAVFDWPGLGSYAAASIISLDTPAIVGITLLVAVVYVAANLAVDLVQAALDPRIRLR